MRLPVFDHSRHGPVCGAARYRKPDRCPVCRASESRSLLYADRGQVDYGHASGDHSQHSGGSRWEHLVCHVWRPDSLRRQRFYELFRRSWPGEDGRLFAFGGSIGRTLVRLHHPRARSAMTENRLRSSRKKMAWATTTSCGSLKIAMQIFGLAPENGVSRYDGKSMTNFTTKEGLVDNSVYTIAQDASGRIWFGTQGEFAPYDGKSFSNLADQVGRSFVNVRSMAVDRSGNLWFGGQEGAFRYDGKTLATFTTKEGLLDNFVGSMIVDREGNLWLGHPGSSPDPIGGGAADMTASLLSISLKRMASPAAPSIACSKTRPETSGSAASTPVHAGTTARPSPISPQPKPPSLPSQPVRQESAPTALEAPTQWRTSRAWSAASGR